MTTQPSPPVSRRRVVWRVVAGLAGLALLTLGAAGAYVQLRLQDSLPILSGERALTGLSSPVRVERDALGVPVVRGQSRADVARATGFLHAQDRFFQMDLLRRRSAGELAELVGAAALPADREVRVLRLRSVAQRAVAALPGEGRALLEAYAAGVAAGLAALGAPPFEYLALRSDPQPWRPEDSLLCALTMYLTLQGELAGQESTLGVMKDVLPPALFEFLTPKGGEWDAPLQGQPFLQPPVPAPDVVDLRRQGPPADTPSAALAPPSPALAELHPLLLPSLGRGSDGEWPALGSNNWAVAGKKAKGGHALLANDMHLGLGVPNTWYRASLVYPAGGYEHRVTGVMLPGAPFVIVGSNRRIAWGFTNSEGDWADLVVLEPDPQNAAAYRTPEGPRAYTHATETVHVKGARDETVAVDETVWGPVVDKDHRGSRRALAWVALRPGGLNAELLRLEQAGGLDEAQAIAPGVGIPNQNFMVADAAGRIGWTIIGRIPRRFGHDGRLPVSWADGKNGWNGWLPAAQYPRITDPPSGRLWTANARVVDGDDLAKVGFGGYDLGARQKQIRDDLMALDNASEADMLRVQLDDRALFLERWQKLLLSLLTPEAVAARPLRAQARGFILGWGGRAAVDSVGYRIVKAFRSRAARDAVLALVAPCVAADPKFDYFGTRDNRGFRQWEGPAWALVSQRPAHLLDPRFASWEALLLGALDAVLDELVAQNASLAARTWGERNTTLIQHPLSRALPALGRFLDMPRLALPGDSHMPRFQSPLAGASERLAVSPGHEESGYFHMPGGQSGHPRSPHYGDGHAAWAYGQPTPFLPGVPVAVLTLLP